MSRLVLVVLLFGCGGEPPLVHAPSAAASSTPRSPPPASSAASSAAPVTPPAFVTTIENVRYEIWVTPKTIPAPDAYPDKPGYGMDIRVRLSSEDGAAHTFLGYRDSAPLFLGQKRLMLDGSEFGAGGEGADRNAPLVTTVGAATPVILERTVPSKPALDPIARGEAMDVDVFLMAASPKPHHVSLARIKMAIPPSGPPTVRIEPSPLR